MSGPHIVLIVMDTARAETVYGPDARSVMPNLHARAASGVTFTNAVANGPWTLPSHASMFSGQRTSDHGTHAGTKRFDVGHPSLPERLSAAGYHTAAFSNNPWISPSFGFDGFDEFSACWKPFDRGGDLASIAKQDSRSDQFRALGGELLSPGGPFTLANALYMRYLRGRYDSGARRTVRRVKRWFERQSDPGPYFTFVNFMEPHLEYDPPDPYVEQMLSDSARQAAESIPQDPWSYLAGETELSESDFEVLRQLYAAELRYLDDRIDELLTFLDESTDDEMLVVIVGDHGENVGEHDMMDHQYCLYDTLLHVPLVVLPPGDAADGSECHDPVELRDLYPTILSFAGADAAPFDESVSRNVLFDGDTVGSAREDTVSEYLHPQPSIETLRERFDGATRDVSRFDRALRAVRTPEWKLVEATDGTVELYDREADPGESRNVAAQHPDVADSLQRTLVSELGPLTVREARDVEIAEGTKQRLDDLGYL